MSYDSVRRWCLKFASAYARRLEKRQGRLGDAWHLDEAVITIQGGKQYLWRAVNQDGDTVDTLVQRRRKKQTAIRFFRRLIKGQGSEPRWLLTDKLRSYAAAHREFMSTIDHPNEATANNRVAVLHQPTRQQEYHMRGFFSSKHAQRIFTLHGLTKNLFRLGRHLMQAVNYRLWRTPSFQVWRESVCA